MSKVKIQGNASGTGVVTLTAPNTNTDRTITLPDDTQTLIGTNASGNVGIGTASPAVPIHIKSSANTVAHFESTDAFSGIAMADTNGSVQMQTSSGYLRFLTGGTASSLATGATEKLRILSSGGITFNGDTAAANALDDYEEGTFTPTLEYGTGITYTSQSGRYTKIGRVVHCTAEIVVSNSSSDASGIQVGGLPFSGNNDEEVVNASLGRYTSFLGAKSTSVRNWRFTGAVIMPMENNDNSVTYNEVASSGTIQVAFSYMTA